MNDIYKAALRYHEEEGWNTIPLCPPDHVGVGKEHVRKCSSPGKRPLVLWKYFQEHCLPRDALEHEWSKHPNANVGVMLGSTSGGLVAVDVDGKAGKELLLRISKGSLEPTRGFYTARGWRLLYLLPESLQARWRNRKGQVEGGEVYFMGQGLQTVMPPSRHVSGKLYQWKAGLEQREVALAPEWALCWKPTWEQVKAVRGAVQEGTPIPEGQRNTTLFRIGCAMRRHGCMREEILVALEVINRRCMPPLERSEVEVIVEQASKYHPYESEAS